jgi:hypothetical protein
MNLYIGDSPMHTVHSRRVGVKVLIFFSTNYILINHGFFVYLFQAKIHFFFQNAIFDLFGPLASVKYTKVTTCLENKPISQ